MTVGALAEDLLHGFYVDDSPVPNDPYQLHATGMELTGTLTAQVQAGSLVSGNGSITAGVSLSINGALDTSPDHKIRLDVLLPQLLSNPIGTFALHGKVSADASFSVGLEVGPFSINAYTVQLAHYDIVNFDTDAPSTPPASPTSPNEITIPAQPGSIDVRPYEAIYAGDQSLFSPENISAEFTIVRGIELLYPNGNYNLFPTQSTIYGSNDLPVLGTSPQQQPAGYYYIDNDILSSGDQRIIVETDPKYTDLFNSEVILPLSFIASTINDDAAGIWPSLSSITLKGGQGNDYFDVSQFTDNYPGTASLYGGVGDNTLIGGTYEQGGEGHATLIGASGKNSTLVAGGDYLTNGDVLYLPDPSTDLGSRLEGGFGGSSNLIGGQGDDWFVAALAGGPRLMCP